MLLLGSDEPLKGDKIFTSWRSFEFKGREPTYFEGLLWVGTTCSTGVVTLDNNMG